MDRLYLIGGAALAIMLALAGGYFYGRSDGTAIEKGKWEVREAKTLTDTNKQISDIYARYRGKEQHWADELQQVSADYEKDLKNANAKTEKLLASVGKPDGVRLRDSGATCSATSGSAMPGTSAAPSRSDGAAGCELSTAATRFLLDLTGAADDAVRRLTACQAALARGR